MNNIPLDSNAPIIEMNESYIAPNVDEGLLNDQRCNQIYFRKKVQ